MKEIAEIAAQLQGLEKEISNPPIKKSDAWLKNKIAYKWALLSKLAGEVETEMSKTSVYL